jgi:hypothetical protein
VTDELVLPDHGGGCITNIVPALLDPADVAPSWLPEQVHEAPQVVLLVLDGLGWEQLRARPKLAPTISAMAGGPITTIAPSTTATALTSISTGVAPGRHGVVGYRVAMRDEILNVLRWTTAAGDARKRISPHQFQPEPVFCSQRPPVVTRTEFRGSGFTEAHLAGTRHVGYRVTSTMVVEVGRLLRAGEPFVYAYYEGVDKVAHEYGLGEHYDAELAFADRLVADLLGVLPPDARLLITADHGEVDVGDNTVHLAGQITPHLARQSGEARFRWLHARPGRAAALLETAIEGHGHHAWVRPREQVVDEAWFGPDPSDAAIGRLGDVALVARGDIAFLDANDTGPLHLIGRHGALTAAEMLVPLLAGPA